MPPCRADNMCKEASGTSMRRSLIFAKPSMPICDFRAQMPGLQSVASLADIAISLAIFSLRATRRNERYVYDMLCAASMPLLPIPSFSPFFSQL